MAAQAKTKHGYTRAEKDTVNFLFAAVVCTVMMALMMRGMGHGDRGRS